MRLTADQQQFIASEVARVFGPDAEVYLFGSRVDDARRGGDIDLYIEADDDVETLFDRKLALYARLVRHLGERRIDLVVHPRGAPLGPVDREAQRCGVRLSQA